MKILNLYAGLGGNRRLWPESVDVTAVEYDVDILNIYKDLYPKDNIVLGDAHEYLINNYKDFDFIWASPPCQTHSSFRQNICVRFRGTPPVYPDMKLWQEIIFLQANGKDVKWVVENVKPYYDALIQPVVTLGRHMIWSNFHIDSKQIKTVKIRKAQIPDLQAHHKIDLSAYKVANKRQLLRNCVESSIGLYLLEQSGDYA